MDLNNVIKIFITLLLANLFVKLLKYSMFRVIFIFFYALIFIFLSFSYWSTNPGAACMVAMLGVLGAIGIANYKPKTKIEE